MILKRALIVSAACIAFATAVGAQPYGGMGLGMMGGYGMGPGMMGGYGMGPGMMGGYNRLDLSAEQRKQIKQIQDETAKAQWQLMGTMHQKGFHMDDVFGWGNSMKKKLATRIKPWPMLIRRCSTCRLRLENASTRY